MMYYSDCLKEFLRPLGIYDLSPGSLSASELDALGLELDHIGAAIDRTEQESALFTAKEEGLDRREALFARTPAHISLPLRRAAIAALLRIGDGDITLAAINNTLSGCGVTAIAEEKDQFGYIRVRFPDIAGIPPDFEQISRIILDIIPCHLDVEFCFRYLTWAECHAHEYTWSDIHQNRWNWYEFQCAI